MLMLRPTGKGTGEGSVGPTEDSWNRWLVTAKQAWGKPLRGQGCGAWGAADLGNSGIEGESRREAALSPRNNFLANRAVLPRKGPPGEVVSSQSLRCASNLLRSHSE